MKKVCFLASVVILVGGAWSSAKACDCEGGLSVSDYWRYSSAIFSGTVISADSNEVLVRVSKVWKGNKPQETTLKQTGWNCDVDFMIGQDYLVYAQLTQENKLQTNICLGTKLFTEAALDVVELDALAAKEKQPAPPPASHGDLKLRMEKIISSAQNHASALTLCQ